jgi:hypothetical protein
MIRIVLPEQPEEHVALAVSPLLECVLSLHVLLGPKHHALHHDWVRRLRTLDPALRKELETLGFAYRHQIPEFLIPRADGTPESFEQEVAHLRALPPEHLLATLGRPLHDHGGAGARVFQEPGVRRAMLDAAGPVRAAAKQLLDRPTEFAGRLAAALERYWEEVFAAD